MKIFKNLSISDINIDSRRRSITSVDSSSSKSLALNTSSKSGYNSENTRRGSFSKIWKKNNYVVPISKENVSLNVTCLHGDINCFQYQNTRREMNVAYPKKKLNKFTQEVDDNYLISSHYCEIRDRPEVSILKWTDEKTRIADKLVAEFPTNIHNYHELFVGGGSVLFAMLHQINDKKIVLSGKVYAYDINPYLIMMFKNIQNDYLAVYIEIKAIFDEFNSLSEGSMCQKYDTSNSRLKQIVDKYSRRENVNIKSTPEIISLQYKKKYYYWLRNEYNKMNFSEKSDFKGSAMFIFLNRTCLRGMFREGPFGFNVPYGHGKHHYTADKTHIERICNIIKDVVFVCCDFAIPVLDDTIINGDFVYIDPPRFPDLNMPSIKHSWNDFGTDQHKLLCNLCSTMAENGVKMMMTNSDVLFIREHFQIYEYCIRVVDYNGYIGDSIILEDNMREVIIKNYNYVS